MDGSDHHLVAVAGDRMGGERHSRRRRVDHHLHQYRHPGRAATMPLVVGGHPLGGGGGETPPHRIAQPFDRDIQVGLVEAGVGRVRQILGGARGAHREPLRPKAACLRLQGCLPPVGIEGCVRDDQARRNREPGRNQLAEDTGLPAHTCPVSGTSLGQIEDLCVRVHHSPHR